MDSIGNNLMNKPIEFGGKRNTTAKSQIASMWANRPIRYLVLCGALLIGTIAAGTAIMVGNFRESALVDKEREMKNTALILSGQIGRSFQSLELIQKNVEKKIHSLGIISSEDYSQRMSGPDVQLMLTENISGLAHVSAISLINSAGILINITRTSSLPGTDLADRDYFKAFISDAQLTSFVSEPVRNRFNGARTVFLARRISSPNGDFIGLVVGSMELSYFENLFESIVLAGHASIALNLADGTLLARYPRVESALGQSFPAGARALGAGDSGTMRFLCKIGGTARECVLAAHRLTNFSLYVTVAVATDEVLADWAAETKLLLSAGGLAALIIAAMILLIVRQMLLARNKSEKLLQEQKLQLDAALNNMMQGLCMFNAEGRIVLFNQRYVQMVGLPADDLVGLSLLDLFRHLKKSRGFDAEPEEYFKTVLADIKQGKSQSRIIGADSGRVLRIVEQPIANGGWVSTLEDITEQRKAEQERDLSREFLDLIVDSVPMPITVKDAGERKYILINQAAEDYFGVSREKVIGKTAQDIWPKAAADLIASHDQELLNSHGEVIFDAFAIDTPTKGSRIMEAKRLAIRNDKGEPRYLLGVLDDVTDRKRANERIVHLAHYDGLTNLPNRALFHEQLEQSLKQIRSGEHLALLYFDLDQFKSVNDTLGHPVGDELLKAVAMRLQECLRETDIVARLGGDEFAIIQSAVKQPSDTLDLVMRIQHAIQKPFECDGHRLVADVSIGIALAPKDGTDSTQLLKNADLAMYGAKAGGRGKYRFFEADMDARVKARRALESDLRQAIVNGGLTLYYQPLVDLRDNKIAGCEALLRWHHPERGMISPAEFIPIAEETGLIGPLGEWVLRTACAEAAAWPTDIKIAVNVSPAQFSSGNLVQLVVNALATSRLPARRLELEITEAVLIRDDEATLIVMQQLRELGVRIALDDFGTGFASLSYLQRFPFDKIKIDRCFINDIAAKDGSLSIVQAVISIAKSRNITTTAEGVETQQQLELLRTLGCTEMQGYLFSAAIPAAELMQLISSCRGIAADAA